MRILVVQESDWLRRNPHQQHHVLERLSAQGHDVLVVDYPIRWRDEGRGLISPRRVHRHVSKIISKADVTVVRTATVRIDGLGKLAWLATNALELERTFRAFKPNVVIILGLSNGLIALRMARAAGIPVVVYLLDALHTLAEPKVLRTVASYVERALLRNADRVMVINKALGDYAVQMGAPSGRIERLTTGVDVTSRASRSQGEAVRKEYGIAGHMHVLLFIGWLYTFSGLDELATALANRASTLGQMRLLVVGDGDLMPKLRRLRDERLGDRLILAGQQPAARMPEFMAAADLCLLPAHLNETMAHIVPVKIYEYLAAGKPILASSLPGLKQEFGEGAGIRYVDGPEELLDEAASLASDPTLLGSLRADACRTAALQGSWNDVTAKFLNVLTTVVDAGQPSAWKETR